MNGKNAALNQFDSMQKLREILEFAELPEVDACSVELFQIFDIFITENENATTGNTKIISSSEPVRQN